MQRQRLQHLQPADPRVELRPDFNDVANLPPLTPRFVYVQQVLFTESFK